MKLVPLDEKDAAARGRLVAFVNAHYASELPLTESAITSGQLRFFCFFEEGGRLLGVTGYQAKTPFLAETVKTVVHPDYRGKGLGAQLSQAMEDELKRLGFKKVMTTILIQNLPMIFVKLKQGYLFEGSHPDHEKPGLHEYSFGKIL